jgi:GAF domain-containing protein
VPVVSEATATAAESERLQRLQALTDAALANLDLEELLSSLLGRTRELLEADTCAVLLLDEDADELAARAAVGIAAERRPVVLDDVDHAEVLNPILREKGIKSLLGVPLLVGGAAIGVLHVGVLHHRVFSDTDVELLQLAGDRAAPAIEHARAYEAERKARERLEHVQAVTDAALAHLELDELLGVLLPRIRSILRADTYAVLLLDSETAELVARAAVGIEEEVERGVRIPLGRGFAGRVAAERRPIILDDVATPMW